MTFPRDRRSRASRLRPPPAARDRVRHTRPALILVRLDRTFDEDGKLRNVRDGCELFEGRGDGAVRRQLAEQRIELIELHGGPILQRRIDEANALGGRA